MLLEEVKNSCVVTPRQEMYLKRTIEPTPPIPARTMSNPAVTLSLVSMLDLQARKMDDITNSQSGAAIILARV